MPQGRLEPRFLGDVWRPWLALAPHRRAVNRANSDSRPSRRAPAGQASPGAPSHRSPPRPFLPDPGPRRCSPQRKHLLKCRHKSAASPLPAAPYPFCFLLLLSQALGCWKLPSLPLQTKRPDWHPHSSRVDSAPPPWPRGYLGATRTSVLPAPPRASPPELNQSVGAPGV